jgi:hypothetical protein
MTLSRRAFLTSTLAVVAASVATTVGDPVRAEAATRRRPLRRSTFAPLVGRTMTATHGTRRTRIRLRRVGNLLGQRGSDASFVLEFSSPHHLTDGIYTISSPRAGRHLVFMSAVNAPAQRRYAVVVNRAIAPA